MSGTCPYEDANSIFDLGDKLRDRDIDFGVIGNDAARYCVSRMMDKNPDTRATLDELIKSDWVTRSGEELLELDYVGGENQLKFRRP